MLRQLECSYNPITKSRLAESALDETRGELDDQV